ncbi:MAG TPA: hypothetical protein VHT91_23530 [Kofleriaceae bacterium]|nr:hypothetical protein [Kofleriaceae bacterium]
MEVLALSRAKSGELGQLTCHPGRLIGLLSPQSVALVHEVRAPLLVDSTLGYAGDEDERWLRTEPVQHGP